MTISEADITAIQGHTAVDALLSPLQLISLDASSGLLGAMRTPAHFGDEHRAGMQHALREYSVAKYPRREQSTQWAVYLLQQYEARWGLDHALLMTEWLAHGSSLGKFGETLLSLLADVFRGKVATSLPIRVRRFQALQELYTEEDEVVTEALLQPHNLASEWDRHCLHSRDQPEGHSNTWDPAVLASLFIRGTGTRLAWDAACEDPPISRSDATAIQRWVESNARFKPQKLPQPDSLLLPPRLRSDYRARGWLPNAG